MKIKISIAMVFFLGTLSPYSLCAETQKEKNHVKYRSQGRLDFESLLIEGERRRPEMSVVTGNIGEKDSGLLKFRKNFLDKMARDLGEKVNIEVQK